MFTSLLFLFIIVLQATYWQSQVQGSQSSQVASPWAKVNDAELFHHSSSPIRLISTKQYLPTTIHANRPSPLIMFLFRMLYIDLQQGRMT